MDVRQVINGPSTREDFFEVLDSEVMWYSIGVNSNYTCNSKDDVVRTIERWEENGNTVDSRIVADLGDLLVVDPNVSSPAPGMESLHHVFRLRDGLIVEMRDFPSRDDALRYAGAF